MKFKNEKINFKILQCGVTMNVLNVYLHNLF